MWYVSFVITAYGYDTAGNLIRETLNGDSTIYEYNNQNQLTKKISKDGVATYTYDKRGNLIEEKLNDQIEKTYKYDSTGKMILGTNRYGDVSEYLYNGLGLRVENTQVLKKDSPINVNYGARSLEYFYGSFHIGDFTDLANRDKNDLSQRIYTDNYGGTKQNEEQVVTLSYLIDYSSDIKRDLAVYEEGSHKTMYTYGMDGRVAQNTTALVDEVIPKNISESNKLTGVLQNGIIKKITTATGGNGENIYTDIAVNHVGKLYYHNGYLGSANYLTDESGNIRAVTTSDEWGNVREGSNNDINIAGLDRTFGYTSYTYDKVLDLSFAQRRFYDGSDRRFISQDPVKDGVNWYRYCEGNPVRFVDPWGEKNVSIVVGGDKASNNNAFKDNANSWISYNMTSDDAVTVIDIGNNTITYVTKKNGVIKRAEHENKYDTVDDVFKAIKGSFDGGPIDELIFEVHSSPSNLFLRLDLVASASTVVGYFDTSKVAKRSTHEYYMDKYINMSYNGIIRFNGCNAGGMNGEVMKDSIAQKVANASGVNVYAFVNSTSQKYLNGRYYQIPVEKKYRQKVVDEQIKFTPIQ